MCGSGFDLRPHGGALLRDRRLHRGADSISLGANVLCQQERKQNNHIEFIGKRRGSL